MAVNMGARAATMELLFVCRCCVLFVLLSLGRLWVCSGCVCVVFWDEALKAAGCEPVVAEHARLIGFG